MGNFSNSVTFVADGRVEFVHSLVRYDAIWLEQPRQHLSRSCHVKRISQFSPANPGLEISAVLVRGLAELEDELVRSCSSAGRRR